MRTLTCRRAASAVVALTVGAGLGLATPGAADAVPGAPLRLQVAGESAAGLPVLTWGAVAGAASYEVQVDDDPSFTSPSYRQSTVNRAAVPDTVQARGVQHWRVRAVDAGRATSEWSEGEFEVAATAAPTLIGPDDGAALPQPSRPPLLRWGAVPQATAYVVQVDDEDRFTDATEYRTQARSLVVPDVLDPAKSYYWRVKAIRGAGVESGYSDSRSFTVGGLAVPVVVSPDSSPSNDLTDVVLDWDPVDGAQYYDLQVSTDSDFSTSTRVEDKTKLVGTRYSPAVTYDNNQYYWRVRAVAPDGRKSDWSSNLSQFRRSWPDRPELVYPDAGDAEVSDPLWLQWTPVAHATQYQVQVGSDPAFSPGTFDACQVAGTTYTPGSFALNTVSGSASVRSHETCYPTPGALTYWRVRPLDRPLQQSGSTVPGVQGLYSETRAFIYQPRDFEPQPDGAPFAPAPGETVDVPALTWSPADNSQRYEVVVRNRAGIRVSGDTTYGNSFTPPRSLPTSGNPYTWTVRAIEADGRSGSLVYESSFQVSGAAPAGDGAAALTATSDRGPWLRGPSLTWEPQPGATSYRVRVYRPGTNTLDEVGAEQTNTSLAYPAMTDTGTAYLIPGDYEWQVTATVAGGSTVVGPRNTFTVGALRAVSDDDHRPALALDGKTLATGRGCAARVAVPDSEEGETCSGVPSTPVFSWDPVPGASFYLLYVSEDDKFTNVLEPSRATPATSNTFWTPTMSSVDATIPDSQAGASYYWFVRPCKTVDICGPDPVSATPSAATNRFQKRSPAVDGLSADTSTGDGSEVTFSWRDYRDTNAESTWSTGEQANQSGMQYLLEVSATPSFATTLTRVAVDQPTYTENVKLYPDGPVWWRVRVIDADDNQLQLSTTERFEKSSPRVTPISPDSAEPVGGSAALRWAARPYARDYQVEVASGADTNFSPANLLFSRRTPLTAYTWDEVIPASEDDYVWRVRKIDSSGNPGPWSGARTFRSAGRAPTQTTPAAGASVAAAQALFAWDLVEGATSYRLEIREGSRSTSVRTASNAYAPPRAFTTGARQWRVEALDAAGHSLGSSALRTFHVDATGPTVTRVTPTASVPRRARFTVSFSEPVRGVSSKSVRLVTSTGRVVPSALRTAASRRSVTLTPRTALRSRSSYAIVSSTSVTDDSGNPLRASTVRIRTR